MTELLSIGVAARLLAVSRALAYRMVQRGQLTTVRIKRGRRYGLATTAAAVQRLRLKRLGMVRQDREPAA